MADNVPITAGAGTDIATDQLAGGAHIQVIKIADGTADSAARIPGDVANGLDVDVTRLPSLPAGEAVVGAVVGKTTVIAITPTISITAYAVGDAIGGLLTFADAARLSGGTLTVQAVILIDKDQEQAEIDLVLFDRTFTPSADNAVFNPSDADIANHIGTIKINPADYANFSTNCAATVRNVGLALKLNGSASLYGQMVIRGVQTYTSTAGLTIKLVVYQD